MESRRLRVIKFCPWRLRNRAYKVEPTEKDKLVAKRACITCGREFDQDTSICPDDNTPLTTFASPDENQLVGTVLNNSYEILEVIGGGGMGLVYKARHRLMNRIVAIKMLHKHMISSKDTLKRFQLEAQAASCLSLPNILTVYDFGLTAEGQPYMVMDYLEGISLADVLEEEGHVQVDRAINIFIQACAGLSHAHEKGVLHRDIKPSNIMLVNFGDQADFVKIVDFGIAKLLNQGPGELTKTGEVYGSPSYMSPEQCRGKETGARSDIYSMGCVMYRTLSGRPLFSGDDIIELLFKQVSEPPAPFDTICPEFNIPPELEAVIFKALAKDPDDRYATMGDFKDALENFKEKRAAKASGVVETPMPLWKRHGDTAPAPPKSKNSIAGTESTPKVSGNGADPASEAARGAAGDVKPKTEVPIGGVPPQPKSASSDLSASRQMPSRAGSTPPVAGDTKHGAPPRTAHLRKRMADNNRVLLIAVAAVSLVAIVAGVILYQHVNHGAVTGEQPPPDTIATTPQSAGGDGAAMTAGRTAFAAKKYEDAKNEFKKALTDREKNFGPKSAEVADSLAELGKSEVALAQFNAAEPHLKDSIQIIENNSGKESKELVPPLTDLAQVYKKTQRLALSESSLKRALSIQERTAGKNDLTVGDLDFELAQTLKASGKSKEADAAWQESAGN